MLVTLLLAFAIIGLASVVQAVSGFGFALLAVPLLTFVTQVDTAVVVGSLASFLLMIVASVRERAHVDWRTARTIMIAAVFGMPVGLLLLETLPDRGLTVLVGASVLVSTWLVWRRPALPNTGLTHYSVGVLTGVLTTATGTNGPPLVAAFQTMGYAPRQFRATIAAIFAGCGFVSIAFFAYGGQLTSEAWTLSLVGVPAVAIGWWAGDILFRRIDAERFRSVVLIALVIAAIVTLVRAFAST